MKRRISFPRGLTGMAIRPRAGFAVEGRLTVTDAALYPLEHDLIRKQVPTFRDHALAPRCEGYSALMPLAATKRVQFLISLTSFACIAGPEMTFGVMSSLARRSATFGLVITFVIAWESLALTTSGKPFGPKMANQKRNSTSAAGTPASCIVGTSGSAGERAGLVTASALILLLSTRPLTACTEVIVIGTWPAITSPIAW